MTNTYEPMSGRSNNTHVLILHMFNLKSLLLKRQSARLSLPQKEKHNNNRLISMVIVLRVDSAASTVQHIIRVCVFASPLRSWWITGNIFYWSFPPLRVVLLC